MDIKKRIAKEGLILFGFVVLGLFVYFIGRNLNNTYMIQHPEARSKVINHMRYSLMGYTPYLMVKNFGLGLAVFGYPLFVILRFILWAIRILKEK